MKKIIMLSLILSSISTYAGEFYFDIGAGYKLNGTEFDHPDYYEYNAYKGPTAYAALGYKKNEKWRVELSHNSNYLIGWPVDHNYELHLTEIRIVYRYSIWRF